MMKCLIPICFTCVLVVMPTVRSSGQIYQDNLPEDHRAIQYFAGAPDDPVAQLSSRLQKGEARLEFRDNGLGYLQSLLRELGINSDSQALVFSKTSLQAAKISPRNPRAVYFRDDVAIGFVPGGDVIELASLDSRRGIIFYTLKAGQSAAPTFVRERVCLKCHQGPATAGVPGLFVTSVYPSSSGIPDPVGAIVTDHRTPFEDRWGGWYVTGIHGEQHHRGNAVATNPGEPEALEIEGTQNLTSLVLKLNPSSYLTPLSDIVALMTLEHQTQMTNLITRVGWQAQIAQRDGGGDESASTRVDAEIDDLVKYMLFLDEPVLQEPIHGVSTFAKTFPELGPFDRQGRTLREFDLQKRLFRYPLSYMVYSAAFGALPQKARDAIYRRLYDVITGRNKDTKFSRLTDEDRRSVLQILRDTKQDLPGYWYDTD